MTEYPTDNENKYKEDPEYKNQILYTLLTIKSF